MPKFKITETRVAHQLWVYEVEAENEQDDLEQVFTGKAEIIDHITEDNGDASDSQFDIIEQE